MIYVCTIGYTIIINMIYNNKIYWYIFLRFFLILDLMIWIILKSYKVLLTNDIKKFFKNLYRLSLFYQLESQRE